MPVKVSVIIPTFNRATFIEEAVKSVLGQSMADCEIVVVDDGSVDRTREVLAPYAKDVKYVWQENRGVSAARNAGLRLAKGKYVAFLDSDDLWEPDKLARQVEVLDANEDIALSYSNISYCDEGGQVTQKAVFSKRMFPSGFVFEEVLLFKVACGYMQTWLVRKKCLDEVGHFEEGLQMSEDRDLALRVAERYKIHGMTEPLTKVRQHDRARRLGHSAAVTREQNYFKGLGIVLERHRANPVVERNRNRITAWYWQRSGRNFLAEREFRQARSRFIKSIRQYPLQFYPYILLLLTLVGRAGFDYITSTGRLFGRGGKTAQSCRRKPQGDPGAE